MLGEDQLIRGLSFYCHPSDERDGSEPRGLAVPVVGEPPSPFGGYRERCMLLTAALTFILISAYLFLGRGREIQGGETRKMVASGATLLDIRPSPKSAPPTETLSYRPQELCPARLLRQHGFTKVRDLYR